MGKFNRNVQSAHEIQNKPLMADEQIANGLLSLSLTNNKKKGAEHVKLRKKKGRQVADHENGVEASLLQPFCRSEKKKRKKMGSPVIVEDTTGEYSVVPLPLTLRHKSKVAVPVSTVSLRSFTLNKKKSPKSVSITTVESFKLTKKQSETRKNKYQSTNIKAPMTLKNSKSPTIKDIASSTLNLDDSIQLEKFKADTEIKNPTEDASILEKSLDMTLELSDETESKQLPRFYCFRNKVLAVMEPDCKFCFHGKVRVEVLYGAVRIYGYIVNSARTRSPVAIYSPRAWSPVAIEAIESEISDRSIIDFWKLLRKQCNNQKLVNRLQSDIKGIEEGWAIVMLQNFENDLTNFLAHNCPFHLFPRIDDPSNHSWRDSRRAEIVLQSNIHFDNRSKQITIDSRGIDDVADAICYDWETNGNSRTIIAGGKRVGKSTMARYLVNKLLAKCDSVIFLDLDPGQAEFTPAGCISLTIISEPLLGPNFTHLKIPYYQLYIGSADVTRCLTHYVYGVTKLSTRLSEDTRLSHCPIVINTMGFCKGIGWDIISYVIKLMSPTDVVQILSRRSRNNFDDSLSRQVIDRQTLGWMTSMKDAASKENISASTRHRLHIIYSEAETGRGTTESWTLEPHQQRELAMISYLSKIVPISESLSLQSRTVPLTINAIPPYVIPFSAVSVSLVGAFVPQVLSVMNGNIVALCGIDPESNSEENNTAYYPRVLIRPPLSTCYGFGILRGVDMEQEQLFVNTPLSLDDMKHVNCLIGSINVPQSLLQLNQEGAPYTGSEYDLPTSRGPRRGYFRTRYQADA